MDRVPDFACGSLFRRHSEWGMRSVRNHRFSHLPRTHKIDNKSHENSSTTFAFKPQFAAALLGQGTDGPDT